MRRTELELLYGPGGWVEAIVRQSGTPVAGHSWVRFAKDDNGAMGPVALFMLSPTQEQAHAIPLIRITLAVNAHRALAAEVEARLGEPVPELGTADFLAAFNGFVHPEPPIVLQRPAGRRLDDDFYMRVADAYRAAAARGMPPRTAIAEAAGVSRDVAGRWVREARKRRYLPKTEPGKVTI